MWRMCVWDGRVERTFLSVFPRRGNAGDVDLAFTSLDRPSNFLLGSSCFRSGMFLHVRSLRRRQSRGEHAIRRAGNVVHSHLEAELDRRRFAAVFAADADLEFGIGFASFLDAHANQLSNAFAIEDRK